MATSYANTTFQVFSNKMGGRVREAYVGDAGEIFYDPNVPELFLSDGVTPGGIPILGTSVINLAAYYTKVQVDQLCANIIGDATANGDTLGELEDRIENNYTLINNLQTVINNYVDQDHQTLAFDPNTLILSISNGNSVDLTPLSQNTTVPFQAGTFELRQWNSSGYTPLGDGAIVPIVSDYLGLQGGLSRSSNQINGLQVGRSYYVSINVGEIGFPSQNARGEIWLTDGSGSTIYHKMKVTSSRSFDGSSPVVSSGFSSVVIDATSTSLKLIVKNVTSPIAAITSGQLSIHSLDH